MKKLTLAMFAGLLCAFGLAANDDVETAEIKNDNSFDQVYGYWCANEGMMKHRPGGAVKKADGGRSGSCMQITNTEKSFSALYSRALIPVDLKADTFKLSFWVKGKGSFKLGFYCYDKNKKFVTAYMEPAMKIDSPAWVKKDFVIPASKIKGSVALVRIAMEVHPGAADLSFDDFSGIKETRLPPQ